MAWMAATTAHAHGDAVGMRAFYDGALAPATALHGLLAVIAVGLLLGTQPRATQPGLIGFFVLLCAGVFAGWMWPVLARPAIALVVAMCIGAMVIVDRPWPPAATTGVAAVAGFAAGAALLPAWRLHQFSTAWIVGALLGTSLCVSWVLLAAERAVRPWQRVAVRVVASWGVAVAFLVLALTMAT